MRFNALRYQMFNRLAPLALAFAGVACQGANMFTVQDDVVMGAQAYEEIQSTSPVIHSGPAVNQVERVTARLVNSALKTGPEIAHLFEWDVCVIDADDTVNAFCLPGGKMAVYTGILPVAGSDAGLAVVLGHEIAHATHRHGTQRVTRDTMISFGIDLYSKDKSEKERETATDLAHLGLRLPFSREHELEADRLGLTYMATAGYDPREAVMFWQRMAAAGSGATLEWLSTHPSDAHRIQQIQSLLPEVIPIYEAAKNSDS